MVLIAQVSSHSPAKPAVEMTFTIGAAFGVAADGPDCCSKVLKRKVCHRGDASPPQKRHRIPDGSRRPQEVHAAPGSQSRCSPVGPPRCHRRGLDDFFGELHEVLRRLSPRARREAIQGMLSEAQRRQLEAWIVTRGGQREARRGITRTHAGPKVRRRSLRPLFEAVPEPESTSIKGVVTYTQYSAQTGHRSTWYYAVVCLPGLHVTARMRRDRAAAVGDHMTLTKAKEHIAAAVSRGIVFDEAARRAFSKLGIAERRPEPVSAGLWATAAVGAGAELWLRYSAAITLVGGFRTMVRAPCVHDLESALAARRSLLEAKGSGAVRSLPHAECVAMMARLRVVHAALYRKYGPSPEALKRAMQTFSSAERMTFADRDASALAHLRRLLRAPQPGPRRRQPFTGGSVAALLDMKESETLDFEGCGISEGGLSEPLHCSSPSGDDGGG